MSATSMIAWVLITVTHVNSGTTTAFQEFTDKPACEFAASAVRRMGYDLVAYNSIRTWCVPRGTK